MQRNFALLLALTCLAIAAAMDVVNMNRNWTFSYIRDIRDKTSRVVSLPHTFNLDTESGNQNYYRGTVVYQKDLTLGAEHKSKYVYLRFKGVCLSATVYLNGRVVGTHKGGYTAFTVDLTPRLKFGSKNTLVVKVSNAFDVDVMPIDGDFSIYGGIYRDVQLLLAATPHISPMDHGSSGVFFHPLEVSEARAAFQSRVILRGDEATPYVIGWNLTDVAGHSVWSTSLSGSFASKGITELRVNGSLSSPHLWNGVIDPYLYRMTVSVWSNGEATDASSHRVGFRFYRVDKEQGFFLNGRHYDLHGVSRHQERGGIANALTRMDHREDLAILEEMGATAVRLSHYPQDEYVMELADEHGLVIWSEIPFIGGDGYTETAEFEANGRQQLREMIHQLMNHPSILFWGLFNELCLLNDALLNYVRSLNALAHQEDPSRLTVAASNIDDAVLDSITDLIGFNVYSGWYNGKPEDITAWAESHQKSHSRPLTISEYGGGGSLRHQQEGVVQTDPNSMWHPENYQLNLHQRYYSACQKLPYLWATFIWNMFDFGSVSRREGEYYGFNDKGLVSPDRHVKKDVFYYYKSIWNKKDPFVYITERRLEFRANATQHFQIFSNQQSVELFLDGSSLGAKSGTSGAFLWDAVPTSAGHHRVEARSGALSDSYDFQRV